MQPIKLKMRLTKGEEIRFVSHLEYARALERALRRAKLPVAYSEGFNPHMKLSLASALAVGTTSQGECAEVELTETRPLEELVDALAAALPPGIQLQKALLAEGPAPKLMASVVGASYLVKMPFQGDRASLAQQVDDFLALTELPYEKRSLKTKAVKTLDLRRLLCELVLVPMDESGMLVLTMKIAMPPEGTIKPLEALQVLAEKFQWPLALERALVERLALYECQKGEWSPMLGG